MFTTRSSRRLKKLILTAIVVGPLGLVCWPNALALSSGSNLIVNPGAEADVGAASVGPVVPPTGWATSSNFTAFQYGAANGPSLSDAGPADRGLSILAGGPGDVSLFGGFLGVGFLILISLPKRISLPRSRRIRASRASLGASEVPSNAVDWATQS